MTTPTLPDLKGFTTHYGLQVSDIGEDGDVIVLGHHEKRRTLAALNRHARTFWGLSGLYDGDLGAGVDATDDIQERWAVLQEHCDTFGLAGHDAPCYTCRGITEADWWIDYSANNTEETPGAFPVMVWSV